MTAAGRRAALHRIIEQHRIESQTQAAELLTEIGYPVTQATVSRDFSAIGAARVRDDVGNVYRIGTAPSGELAATLDRFVLDVVPSGNLVIIKTPPAAAHYVASALDGARLSGIAGTVAGDDTLLIVATPDHSGQQVAEMLTGGGV